MIPKVEAYKGIYENTDKVMKFPCETFPNIRGFIRGFMKLQSKEDVLGIKSYEVAYATLQALHTHGLDLQEEFDGGEIDLHKGSGKTLEDFKRDIAQHLKIDKTQGGGYASG